MEIHITRNGERHGPYPEASAREMLAAGQLQPTDLAWHAGADGWKPLSEVLGAAAQPSATPPPLPPELGAPAEAAETKPAEVKAEESEVEGLGKIQVTRGGEAIGPYSWDKAREYFIAGQLLPTDWGWHDGMDEWKPLNEVLGLPTPAPMASAHSAQPIADPARAWSGNINLVSVAMKVVPSLVLVLAIVSLLVSNEMKALAGIIIMMLGIAVATTGAIWFLVEGFKESVGWGVGMLLCGFLQTVFLVMHRDVASRPFLTQWVGIGITFLGYFVGTPSEEGSNLSAEERKLVGKFEHISADGDTERWTFLKDNVAEKYKNGKKEGTSYKWKIYQTRWWKRDKGIIDGTIYVEHEDGSVTGFSREVIYTSMQAQAPIQEITISFFIGKDGEKQTWVGVV